MNSGDRDSERLKLMRLNMNRGFFLFQADDIPVRFIAIFHRELLTDLSLSLTLFLSLLVLAP